MTSTKQDLEKLMATLAQQRDELKLQLHLAKAEAKDEWDALEGKWEQAQGKLAQVQTAAGESLEDVRAAASLLADELKNGYERIRKLF
jgi:uncharacterized protein YjbJ (UPF0337 family)